MNTQCDIFQYYPFSSFVSPTFWYKLSDVKLDDDRLSDDPKPIYGYYTNFNAKSCLLEVDYSSFNKSFSPPNHCHPAIGTLYNKNTIEDFKECDKNTLITLEGQKLLEDIKSGRAIDDPKLLARFMILSFADLKNHNFFYWFAFPCPVISNLKHYNETKAKSLSEFPELFYFCKIITSMKPNERNFFILRKSNNEQHFCLKDIINVKNPDDNFQNEDIEDFYFCFSDPSEFKSPSWLMRIYALVLYLTCPKLAKAKIKFLAVRYDKENKLNSSLIYDVYQPATDEDFISEPVTIGWEPNRNKKMGPRIVSMRDTMDSDKLAEKSIYLNLKLMKWRLIPEFNLDINAKTKCLLFGAGTLGCAVARNLIAWGFKYITLLDNGKVGLSNPVRQNLYTHADAVSGNSMKATTAAKRLKEINPNAITEGFVLQIPMPGHTIGKSLLESVEKDLQKIISLVQEHDVIFLLTDSRESRWLPSMLGAAYKKMVINSALGFDSYLVTRHGSTKPDDCSKPIDIGDLKCVPGSELGCYFCNDVTAPGNSLKDRTLDQQCTVTRPGVSNIAASYAVELAVALLQHPQQDLAPAYYSIKSQSVSKIPEGLLGIIPHSIRGMLCNYENILPATMKFNQCVACSEKIILEYFENGLEFLFKAFETAKYLENITGISDFEDLDNEIIEFDDSDLELSDK